VTTSKRRDDNNADARIRGISVKEEAHEI
jgi:hypothetical protein